MLCVPAAAYADGLRLRELNSLQHARQSSSGCSAANEMVAYYCTTLNNSLSS
jgi:hypothetical protein